MLSMHAVIKNLGNRSFGPYNLQIRHAECVAIVGPNGAGKSTLLKLLSGSSKPSAGFVLLHSRSLDDWTVESLSQCRAVLSQSQEIAFALTTRIVIGLGRVARVHAEESNEIVFRAAALLGLNHLLDRKVDTLSGGEWARVQLARVFAQLWDVEDGFILMDEPIAAVDPGQQDILLEILMRFARIRRLAVIAVLHDLNHALRYFGRMILVHPAGGLESVECGYEAKEALERLYGVRFSCMLDEQDDLVMLPLREKARDRWTDMFDAAD